jgi:hypothetical protein
MSWSCFDQSLSVYSRTRPGCAYRDRRRTDCLHVLLVCVAGRHRAWGELSRKVRLIIIAPDASLRRVACVLACKCPGRGFHAMRGDHRGAHRFGPGTNRFAAGSTKVGLDLPRPPRIGLSVGAQEALQLSPVERSGSAGVKALEEKALGTDRKRPSSASSVSMARSLPAKFGRSRVCRRASRQMTANMWLLQAGDPQTVVSPGRGDRSVPGLYAGTRPNR